MRNCNKLAAIVMLTFAMPAISQINDTAVSNNERDYLVKANTCLAAFDQKAKARKLSADTYKTALDGACTQEIRMARNMFGVGLGLVDDDDSRLLRFDRLVQEARAKMVSSYIMR